MTVGKRLTCCLLAAALLLGALPGARGADPAPNLRKTVVVDVAEKTKAAVVYISTTKTVLTRVPLSNDPFFAQWGTTQLQRVGSLGSGFIVHKDGYVVTNHHVIAGVREIKVELLDGRKFSASMVSSDQEADLAVLKIDSKEPLPTIELGDSSDLMIGEPVIAVGNPLGFSHSVSSGIVSALHRDLPRGNGEPLKDVIQTDAAINVGNSGGPLLNAYAQVIGINTAIRSDAQNIGFAIQVNRLRDLVPDLMSPEQVKKNELPIKLSESRKIVEPATVQPTIHVDGTKEIVRSIGGHTPHDIVDAYARLLTYKPGETFELVTDKGSRKITGKEVEPLDVIVQAKERLGLTVEQVTPLQAGRLGIDQEAGVLITKVEPGSIGDKAGLQKDDVIIQIGRAQVLNLATLGQFIKQIQDGKKYFVGIVRPGEQRLGTTSFDFGRS